MTRDSKVNAALRVQRCSALPLCRRGRAWRTIFRIRIDVQRSHFARSFGAICFWNRDRRWWWEGCGARRIGKLGDEGSEEGFESSEFAFHAVHVGCQSEDLRRRDGRLLLPYAKIGLFSLQARFACVDLISSLLLPTSSGPRRTRLLPIALDLSLLAWRAGESLTVSLPVAARSEDERAWIEEESAPLLSRGTSFRAFLSISITLWYVAVRGRKSEESWVEDGNVARRRSDGLIHDGDEMLCSGTRKRRRGLYKRKEMRARSLAAAAVGRASPRSARSRLATKLKYYRVHAHHPCRIVEP